MFSCIDHLWVQLNIDQGDLINNFMVTKFTRVIMQIDNRTVKFVVSCCGVTKQVDITTILALVEVISYMLIRIYPVLVH